MLTAACKEAAYRGGEPLPFMHSGAFATLFDADQRCGKSVRGKPGKRWDHGVDQRHGRVQEQRCTDSGGHGRQRGVRRGGKRVFIWLIRVSMLEKQQDAQAETGEMVGEKVVQEGVVAQGQFFL